MGWQNHAGDDFLANANDIVNEQARIVGLRIKYKRREKGMLQDELAEKMGIGAGQLSCIARGKYLPTTQNIYKICDILGEDPNYYLKGYIRPEREEYIIKLMKSLPESYQQTVQKSIEMLAEAYKSELK